MKPYYYNTVTSISSVTNIVVYEGRSAAQAARVAADLVRFGLVPEASVKGFEYSWQAKGITTLGRVLKAALAAHKAGVA